MEILGKNIVCIIAFAAIWADIFLNAVTKKLMICYTFDYLRIRNYKRFVIHKLILTFMVGTVATLIHTIIAYFTGFENIDAYGVLLILLAALSVNTTLDTMVFSYNVVGLMGCISLILTMAVPAVGCIGMIRYHFGFDKYIAYMDIALLLFELYAEIKFYRVWKREDIK